MSIFHQICKFARLGWILSLTLSTALLLSSCSGLKTTPVEEPQEPVSVITGKPGLTKLSDLMKEDRPRDGLPVNALLWRAALDIASYVPLMTSIHLVAALLPNGTSPKTHLISV